MDGKETEMNEAAGEMFTGENPDKYEIFSFIQEMKAQLKHQREEFQRKFQKTDEMLQMGANAIAKEVQRRSAQVQRESGRLPDGELNQHCDDLRKTFPDKRSTTDQRKRSAKLQAINIPPFSGDIRKFGSFKELFLNIYNNAEVSDMEKFAALKTKLTNEALSTISHLHLVEENYPIAWKLLTDKFEDASVMMSAIWSDLLNAEKTLKNDPDSLENLMMLFQCTMHNIFRITKNNHHEDSVVQVIIRKFDADTYGKFNEFMWKKHSNSKEIPKKADVIEFFQAQFNKNYVYQLYRDI